MTQHEQILAYMDLCGSITPFDAFRDLGITKLATRISEMTADGSYTVKKTPIVVNGTRYMSYSKIVKKRKVEA